MKFLKSLFSRAPASPSDRIAELNDEVRKKFRAGEFDAALDCAAQATRVARDGCGDASDDFALALVAEGFLHFVLARHESAPEFYRRALPIYLAIKPGIPFFVDTLLKAGVQLADQEKLVTARAIFECVEDLYRRGGFENTSEFGHVRSQLDRVQEALRQRDSRRAEAEVATVERMIQTTRDAGDSVDLASALNAKGLLLKREGDLTGAIKTYSEALEAAGNDVRQRANSMNNLGIAHRAAGDVERAASFLGEAATLRRRELGDAEENTLATLYNLADAQAALGQFSSAAASFALWAAGNPDTKGRSVADIAQMIAEGSLRDHQANDAIAYTKLSLYLREHVERSGWEPLGRALWHGAGILHDLGDTASAMPLLQRAVQLLEKTCGPNDEATVNARVALETWSVAE